MPKRKFDRLDAEAEREAGALIRMREAKPRIVGHRLHQIRRMHSAGARLILTKIERRHT